MWTQYSDREQMIRELLIVDLADDDILLILLGQSDQGTKLNNTIRFI